MKKLMRIFMILGLTPLFFACATNSSKDETFVNPIFYETLEPSSANASCAKLTPTTIYWASSVRYDCDRWLNEDLNNPEKTDKYACKLIKDTGKELTYLCENQIETLTIENQEKSMQDNKKTFIRYKYCDKDYPDFCGNAYLFIK